MFETGYWTAGHWRGVPVRLHWSLPVGALILGGLSPVFWIAFFGLILIHEMGHAILVKRYGHRVVAIDITGIGGLCRWSGHHTQHERSVIAWGGVAAQAVVLVGALLVVAVAGWPAFGALGTLFHVLIKTNVMLIVLNLLPMKPFDGADAWKLVSQRTRLFP